MGKEPTPRCFLFLLAAISSLPGNSSWTHLTRRERSAATKVFVTVRDEFSGDAHAAFRKFDGNADDMLNITEVEAGLAHCGVGNEWTMHRWISRVLTEFDQDQDDHISIPEVQDRLQLKLSYRVSECNDPNCVVRRGKTLQTEKDYAAGEELW